MKKIAIFFASTQNNTFALANVLFQLKSKCKKLFTENSVEIFVFSNDISSKTEKILNKILNIKVLEFNINNNIKRIINTSPVKRVSPLVFSKFSIFSYLSKYNYVLWLDTDIIIKKDISSIFNYGPFGIAEEKNHKFYENFITTADIRFDNLNINRKTRNSGIIIASNQLNGFENIESKCYHILNVFYDMFLYADQPILNVLLQTDIKQEVNFPLDIYNAMPKITPKNISPVIIHCYGDKKPWNHYYFIDWYINYFMWRFMGGDSYSIKHDWKRLLSFLHFCGHHIKKIIKNIYGQ